MISPPPSTAKRAVDPAQWVVRRHLDQRRGDSNAHAAQGRQQAHADFKFMINVGEGHFKRGAGRHAAREGRQGGGPWPDEQDGFDQGGLARAPVRQ